MAKSVAQAGSLRYDLHRRLRIGANPPLCYTLLQRMDPVPRQKKEKARLADEHWLIVADRPVRLLFMRHLRARQYVLRLRQDGVARVTIPRGGSVAEARRFAERNTPWLQKQLVRLAAQPARSAQWLAGRQVLFRGRLARIELPADGSVDRIHLDGQVIRVANAHVELRGEIEGHLWELAARELPGRVGELARANGLTVRRVTVRNQRSRWGSCSRRGTVSLNWRLVQAPESVRDYIILHELAHLREMNHSQRFWREVERMCPGYEEAERWLNRHAGLLHGETGAVEES